MSGRRRAEEAARALELRRAMLEEQLQLAVKRRAEVEQLVGRLEHGVELMRESLRAVCGEEGALRARIEEVQGSLRGLACEVRRDPA